MLVLFLGWDGILKKDSVNTIMLSVLALPQEILLAIIIFPIFQQAMPAVETSNFDFVCYFLVQQPVSKKKTLARKMCYFAKQIPPIVQLSHCWLQLFTAAAMPDHSRYPDFQLRLYTVTVASHFCECMGMLCWLLRGTDIEHTFHLCSQWLTIDPLALNNISTRYTECAQQFGIRWKISCLPQPDHMWHIN